MSTTIEAGAQRQDTGSDIEKSANFNNGVQEVNANPNNNKEGDSDAESENFQGGVQRVRAITSVWTKKTLISMFVL